MYRNYIKQFLLMTMLCAFAGEMKAQVNITDSVTAQMLVQTLVGPGISYSNPVLNCAQTQSGTFTVVSSNLGIGDGIILTSGRAETDVANNIAGANGPQGLWFPSDCVEPGGVGGEIKDTMLENISGVQTHDACILEFDFVPDGDSLLFDYVFGSEEYDGYSCSGFNDVFAFFLSGPGITGAPNVALIPGTNIPVAINSTTDPAITQPFSLTACQAMGPGSPFAQYYVDNSAGSSITYYGFTKVLTARAAVLPCTTYHIKLAIADGGDCILDSGVFLEANSFRSTNIKLDLESSLGPGFDYLVEGCSQAQVVVKRNTAFPIPQTVKLTYTGVATKLMDYGAVPDSVVIPANDTVAGFTFPVFQDNIPEGSETITINIVNICTGDIIDSVTFTIYDQLPATFLGNDTTICQGQGVRLQAEGHDGFTWAWKADPDGQIDDPTQKSTWAHPQTTTTYYVSASFQQCFSDTFSLTATVEPNPIVDISPNDTAFCLSDPYPINASVGPDGFNNYTYTWTPATDLDNANTQYPYFYTQQPGEYRYTLTVTTPIGCTSSDTVLIVVRPAVELKNVTGDFTLKYGETKQLNAEGATYYTWTPDRMLNYPNEPDPTVTGWDPETFQVIGTDQWGCRDTAYVKMNIDYTMFEWLPNAFSPNGDGRNDVFSIKNMKYQRLIEFRIFNRWGQEIFTSTDAARGWDGTYHGEPQEIGVYHYIIRVTTPDGQQRSYKGDVSLIR